mmetsp:Transcript_50163/g.119425  ORF Transcript_50163/g.119425 Transcript_50163/m.119425 type:complete len:596 (-) Transcript_50163:109-1896(-)
MDGYTPHLPHDQEAVESDEEAKPHVAPRRSKDVPPEWKVPSSWRQKFTRGACVFFNVLCGFTNGYDLCVTSVILDNIVQDLDVCYTMEGGKSLPAESIQSCAAKQAILSLQAAGSLFALIFMSWIADRFGRRAALLLIDITIIVALLLQSAATSTTMLLLGRFLLGIGLGFSFVVAPAYICEIAPPERRGQYVVMNEVAVCIGCLAGLDLGRRLVEQAGPQAWRYAVGIGCVPSLIQLFCIPAMPESPRWLAVQGLIPQLQEVGMAIGLSPAETEKLQEQAERAEAMQGASGGLLSNLKSMWTAHRLAWSGSSGSFFLALVFSSFVNSSGIYAMQAYGLDILQMSGVDKPLEVLPLVGWMKLVGAMAAVGLADAKWAGRTRLAGFGAAGCAVCMGLLSVRQDPLQLVQPQVASVAFFCFVLFWNIGYGSLQFVATLELLPSEVRALWAGAIGAWTKGVDVLIFQLFETLLVADGMLTFAAFTIINVMAAFFAVAVMPDVAGRSLEETGSSPVFNDGVSSAKPTADDDGEFVEAGSIPARAPHGGLSKQGWGKHGRYGKLVDDEAPDSPSDMGSSGHSGSQPDPSVVGRTRDLDGI